MDIVLHFHNIRVRCDNTSAINISKNSVLHSWTEHTDVRHYFLRDHVEKQDVPLIYIDTKHQLADIFTKPLCEVDFYHIRGDLGMWIPC